MIRLRIKTNDTATPVLGALARRAADRPGLLKAVAVVEENLFRSYIGEQALVRHNTSQRLGASPTGELEKAAQSPEGTATDTGVRITIRPGYLFARAFRNVEIVPQGGKKYLTIPVAAESYGRRAAEFRSLRFYRPGPLSKNLVAGRPVGYGKRGTTGETLFILVPRVRQTQDRTLLPSDDGILQAAEEAAKDYLLKKAETGGVP